jgi:sulfate permease, SulP family
VDSLRNARNVREDTAELASYALSDQTPLGRSPSPRSSSAAQSHIDSYFPSQSEDEASNHRTSEDLRRRIIDEVSEPESLEQQAPWDKPRSNSMIANMFRRPPEDAFLPFTEDMQESGSTRADSDGGPIQTHMPATSNGAKVTSEQTPLLGKSSVETSHPDYLHGGSDLEGQGIKKRKSWPKLRQLLSTPGEKGVQFFRTLSSPKTWNRKTIWQNAIATPSGYIPAIILGTLLTILDALSYGMLEFSCID